MRQVLAVGALIAGIFAAPLSAEPVTLSAVATAGTATSKGVGNMPRQGRAYVTVTATDANGAGVDDLSPLGPQGDGVAPLLIPNWEVRGTFIPNGASCGIRPTQIENLGQGLYILRLASASNTQLCRWEEGDYHAVIRVFNNGNDGATVVSFRVP